MKVLEMALEGKSFFGGNSIGYVAWIGLWAQIVGQIVNTEVISELYWVKTVAESPIIKESTPSKDKLLEHFVGFRKMLTTISSATY